MRHTAFGPIPGRQVTDTERRQVAHYLHEGLAQTLAALRMRLGVLEFRCEDPSPLLRDRIKDMRVLVDDAIADTRQLAARLHPDGADGQTAIVLECLVRDFQRRTGIACGLHADHEEVRLLNGRGGEVIDIVDATLGLLSAQVGVARVDVLLRRRAGEYVLTVRADGGDFDPAVLSSVADGIGKNAAGLGGCCDLSPSRGRGAVVRVRFPVGVLECVVDRDFPTHT